MAYATADEIAAWLEHPAPDAEEKAKLGRLADTATAMVDRFCSRTFEQSASETRLFDIATSRRAQIIGDVVSVSQVQVRNYSNALETLTADDWRLEGGRNRRPHYKLTLLRRLIPQGAGNLQVTGRWGWPQVPADVVQATIMIAARLSLRDQSPQGQVREGLEDQFGVAGGIRGDSDLMDILDSYKIPSFGGARGSVV